MRWLAALLLAFTTACATSAPYAPSRVDPALTDPDAAPTWLWRVQDVGRPGVLYVLGTQHMRTEEAAGLDAAVLAVTDEADVLVTELGEESLGRDIAILPALLFRGVLPDGKTLPDEDVAGPELGGLAVDALVDAGLDPDYAAHMRPWLAAMMLAVMRAQERGEEGDAGVESVLATRWAEQPGRPHAALETVDEQLAAFSDIPPDVELQLLQEAVDGYVDTTEESRISEAYNAGDEDTLAELILDMPPALRKSLIDDRNARMVARLLPRFDERRVVLVAVGAGHVIGPTGLVAEFERLGFRVERVPPRGRERVSSSPTTAGRRRAAPDRPRAPPG